jgi:hypothetical protein
MGHDHSHEGNAYYLEQLWTIATCGALGIVMILLWQYQVLAIFLTPTFHGPVLWGGIALLVLVAIRMVSLWFTVSAARRATAQEHDHSAAGAHDHGHTHGPDCDHTHDHHDHVHGPDCDHEHGSDQPPHVHAHDHGHDHEHGWAPWRYAVLLLPIVLFLMKLPWPQNDEPVDKGTIEAKLADIEASAEDQSQREFWKEKSQTTSVYLRGKLGPIRNDREFGIGRLKMTCCFADAYPEPARIIIQAVKPVDKLEELNGKWVKVIGKVDYIKGASGFFPVVFASEVKKIATPSNQFNN